jgi:TPR repeat protein
LPFFFFSLHQRYESILLPSMFIVQTSIVYSFFVVMASSFDIPLSLHLQWYKVRDFLLGGNNVARDVEAAIKLAASCDHPDARWLTAVCAGKDVKTVEQVKDVFLSLGQGDARALCFTWFLDDRTSRREDLEPLRRSSGLGFGFASALLAWRLQGEERVRYAKLAARDSERSGFYWLGVSFRDGKGCEKNLDKAKECFLAAAERESVLAMIELGHLLNESDPQRWYWWGVAASKGLGSDFMRDFPTVVGRFNSGNGSGAVLFSIGRALKGHIHVEARKIFTMGSNFESWIGPSNQAVAFYHAQIESARLAVDAWTVIAIRLKVVKDIRMMVAQLIWKSRSDGEWQVWWQDVATAKRTVSKSCEG